MATIRKLCCNDFLRFASVNLDYFTNTSRMSLNLTCLATWPNYSHAAVAPGNRVIGYIMGATEEDTEGGKDEHWKGLAMTVDVHPEHRRDREYYLYLYVDVINTPAKKLFGQLGYKDTRRLAEDFYMNNKDEYSFEMRKELSEEEDDPFLRYGSTSRYH